MNGPKGHCPGVGGMGGISVGRDDIHNTNHILVAYSRHGVVLL